MAEGRMRGTRNAPSPRSMRSRSLFRFRGDVGELLHERADTLKPKLRQIPVRAIHAAADRAAP